jgi:hypothetical protein
MLRQVFHAFLGLPQYQGNPAGGSAQFGGAFFQRRSRNAFRIKHSIRRRRGVSIKIWDI